MTHKTEVEKVVLDDGTPAYRFRYQCDKEEMQIIESMTDEQREQFVRTLSARKVGNAWLIDRGSVDNRASNRG